MPNLRRNYPEPAGGAVTERIWWLIRLAAGLATALLVESATHVLERWGTALGILALFAVSFAVVGVLEAGRWSYRQAANRDRAPR